ncbi:DUF819 domain-containing protein [Shewanella intestini]|uniref:DUF819 family protein n=1 Tax=Shewanella intestini TaxID=2017544 RepID=A0ABS5I603_9GAMM|nr:MULTISPECIES: DUF819 family protein [Shewanella]MBR9729273.1 DUF819 family protein [Shewanella intestini]MRG35418.1 DUF819 family protein [Shewanella sp. XMDDZSB0408]
MINQDPIIFSVLCLVILFILYASKLPTPWVKKVFSIFPTMVLCYIIPSLLNSLGIIDSQNSALSVFSSNYLMPACLTLLIIGVDLKSILQLSPKIIILFIMGSFGVLLGGPITLWIISCISPDSVAWSGTNSAWRGMATLAGNWIGGTANQLSMKDIFNVENNIFTIMISVNVVFSAIWMTFLLFLAKHANAIDKKINANTINVTNLIKSEQHTHLPISVVQWRAYALMFLIAVVVTTLAHYISNHIAPFIGTHYPQWDKFSLSSKFFWLVISVTTLSLLLANTRVRQLEKAGTTKVASGLLYFIIANMGLQMDLTTINHFPIYFFIGFIWLSIHGLFVLITGLFIRAPVAYMALSSQCCIGGAASAPVVAMAFHRSLTPIAILLSVFGYAWATYMAWLCAALMQGVTP